MTLRPFAGQQVEILSPTGMDLKPWDILLDEWQAQTGATATLGHWDPATLPKSPVPTGGRLLIVPNGEIAALDDAGLLTPIAKPAEQFGVPATDFCTGLRQRLMERNRRIIAMPVSQPVVMLYYRRDLLDKAGLKPPATWEDYQQLVLSVTDWGRGLPAVEPWAASSRNLWFYSQLLPLIRKPDNLSVWFDIDTGEAALHAAAVEAVLTSIRDRWPGLTPESQTLTLTDCRDRVINGKAALGIGCEPVIPPGSVVSAGGGPPAARSGDEAYELGVAKLPATTRSWSPTRKQWETLTGPTYAPGLLSEGWSVCWQAPSQWRLESDAEGLTLGVMSFANMLLDMQSQFDMAFPPPTQSPVRETQLQGWPPGAGIGLDGSSGGEALDTIARVLRDPAVTLLLPVKGREDFLKATEERLAIFFQKMSAPETTATELQAAFASLVKDHGAAAIRDSYRRSLGLAPRS